MAGGVRGRFQDAGDGFLRSSGAEGGSDSGEHLTDTAFNNFFGIVCDSEKISIFAESL